MRSPRNSVRFGAAVAGIAALMLSGCSSGTKEKDTSAAPSAAPGPSSAQAAAPGGPSIGVSPGGVTTRVDVPAQSTEEQYGQSCLAAKDMLGGKGGDPHDHVEPLLKDIQTGTQPSPVTFNKTWSELSTAQQAAVLIAVTAAADGGC